ncbi:oxidoreductase [Alsobacter metallidurans]|uniref:Oxidoreductase n=1 Tax=Alsobacter metallidurans TaxID=340221 RepID=A0A917I7D3_9HYPH|nr:Gfo/Idh/MocA family oxidoreductase [Alsobacter metallidurans]GGH18385.1 oxidoreductase [Alsobacter metallidurans]
MRELGVGVVGCGVISTIYMQNMPLFRGVRLVACADLAAELARSQAEKFGARALTIDALMRDPEVDVVLNLTPPNAHFEVSHAALTAGKHVFTEKPLCVSAEDGRRLLREADGRGLKLGCAPDTFLGAGGRLARETVDSGQIGRVLAGSCFLMSHGMEHWHPNPEFFFKPGGGPILDIGPYYLGALCNLLGPVASVQALSSTGFAERIVSAEGPRKGDRIKVETPTTVMALLRFAGGADLVFSMSWDVWKHGHPPIELYGTEGSFRAPDPNFFGGVVEVTARGEDWRVLDSSSRLYGKPNWRSPNWAPTLPDRANYRCLGLADLASAVLHGTPHRSSGAFASHVLDVMHAILQAGVGGGAIRIESRVERPAPLSDEEAASYWRGQAA